MKNFLVTGGAGFIGSNLTEKLIVEGHRVRVFDSLATGKMENLKGIAGQVEFIKGDVRDPSALEKAVEGMEFLIHLAAMGSVPRSVADPATTHEVNATGTLNVLNAARAAGVKRVVYASSSSVYGDTPVLPKSEDMNTNPMSPYAVSKLCGEHYCRVFFRVYGLETVCLRYFNVYGKRQDPASQYAAVIPRFITSVLRGKSPSVYGDGEQTRDFTFVDDCNQANYKACIADGAAGLFFNIGTGRRISLNELYGKIRAAGGSDLEPVHTAPRHGDVRHSLADITRASEMLGYAPGFDIDSGIRETVKWYTESVDGATVR